MDYTKTGLGFRIRKVIRYIQLYGLTKTIIKVRGQYHMKAGEIFNGERWVNKACRNPDAAECRGRSDRLW